MTTQENTKTKRDDKTRRGIKNPLCWSKLIVSFMPSIFLYANPSLHTSFHSLKGAFALATTFGATSLFLRASNAAMRKLFLAGAKSSGFVDYRSIKAEKRIQGITAAAFLTASSFLYPMYNMTKDTLENGLMPDHPKKTTTIEIPKREEAKPITKKASCFLLTTHPLGRYPLSHNSLTMAHP